MFLNFRTTLFSSKEALSFLKKHPILLFFGAFFTLGTNFPITLDIQDPEIFLNGIISNHNVQTIFSFLGSPKNILFFGFLTLLIFWLLKILSLVVLYQIIFDFKKKMPIFFMEKVKKGWKVLSKIAFLHLAVPIFLFSLGIFLLLPTISLIESESVFSAWFVGIFAVGIFFVSAVIIFVIALFSHFFILFGGLSLKEAINAGSALFRKKTKEIFSFLFFLLGIFFIFQGVLYFFPGFILSDGGIFPLYGGLPLYINSLGCFFSFLLSSFYYTFFPAVSLLFFLHIAKQPKKKSPAQEAVIEEILQSAFLKKKTETLQEKIFDDKNFS